ncbi:MAG: RedB protein [Cyanobacteria bacterium SZAS-4]|nr:RedB protein [Cyanobacteria bacterium SZAS-4]
MNNIAMISATLAWIGMIVIGTTISATYENRPGDQGYAPTFAVSKHDVEQAKVSKTKFHIIMFVHPKCPCSRASISELRNLMETFPSLKATVFFYKPATAKSGWEKTELWKTASAVENITPQIDIDGQKAKSYRVVTSGEVLLYDASERLVFSGGITGARGHVGDNLGEDTIEKILTKHFNTAGQKFSAPVFGCRIMKDGTQVCSAKSL